MLRGVTDPQKIEQIVRSSTVRDRTLKFLKVRSLSCSILSILSHIFEKKVEGAVDLLSLLTKFQHKFLKKAFFFC